METKTLTLATEMKLDLSKLPIRQLNGEVIEHDFSKDLAQAIFSNTQKIEEHAFSVDLYKNPIIELTEENKAIIKEYTEKYFKAFVNRYKIWRYSILEWGHTFQGVLGNLIIKNREY